jgi:hypothetical protein
LTRRARLLALCGDQQARAGWSGARAPRRPAGGAQRERQRARCLVGYHALGTQRVHLLGRGRQAGSDPTAPHSSDPRGARRRPAPALLLARLQAPRAHGGLSASRTVACLLVRVRSFFFDARLVRALRCHVCGRVRNSGWHARRTSSRPRAPSMCAEICVAIRHKPKRSPWKGKSESRVVAYRGCLREWLA